MQQHDYSYVLSPFHTRLRMLRASRSQSRDELFLLLHYHGPSTRQHLREKLSTGRTAFYLNFQLFLRIGVAQENRPGVFELTDRFKQHHHYMWCRICRRATGFYDEALEKAFAKFFNRGFAVEDHEFTISGICPKCLLKPENRPNAAIGMRFRRNILKP